ncbi:MAG: glucoamylase family protein, partial [Clostridia bacterium]
MGILGIAFFTCYYFKPISILVLILSISWLIAPAILCKISKDNKLVKEKLSHLDEQYLLEIGQKTWKYFEDYLTQEYHFLPPDNYQEDRRNKIVPRTSSTNIGLALLSVLSAYDLKYIEEEKAFFLLENMLLTIEKLQKWNGHLYNWYDIKTLEPLMPRYISTVDSGNFISYLYALKSFLKKKIEDCDQDEPKMQKLELMLDIVTRTIQNTDFSKLYDFEKRIFSIGYNIEENKLTDSYYDLLASEARTASLVAIAKKDVPYKHWYNLSRTLTVMNQYKGLVSWSGTSFEYLMPNVVIPKYIGSLLDESCQFMIMSQKEYCKRLGIPWGISEAAFNLKDLNNNYQYKAFGIPWLGLKRGLGDDMVVSSYGSILALTEQPKNVVENIRKLDKQGMYQKYGFYESIDYTASRLRKSHTYELVKTYMAHHQALILLTINNYFNQNILQTRFMDNPELQGTQILLQERMPENVIITKEKKEKIEKLKYADYENYTQRCYHKVENRLQHGNVIANGEYTIVWDDKGCGYSKYKNILINRYKKTDDIQQGIFFYFKNIKSKRIWTASYMNYLGKADKYDICFAEDKNKITRMDGNIETVEEVTIGANEPVEIRKIELTNYGNLEETIEITSVLEPVLSTMQQDYAHPAFNNLFLTLEYDQETQNILVKRKARLENESEIYLA